jgi:hypothetical protein
MQIDLFTLDFWKFIFSSIWVFLGFIIILTILNGDFKRGISKIKLFSTRVSVNYKKFINRDKTLNKLNQINKERVLKQ